MSDNIDYGSMIEQAYIGITKKALTIVSNDPEALGKYNIMISFDTTEKGVLMPNFLKLRYPDNMSVVLNNVYSNLVVDDFGFKVVLTFGGQSIEIGVPFSSILHYHDLTTNFMFGVRETSLDDDSFISEEMAMDEFMSSIEQLDVDENGDIINSGSMGTAINIVPIEAVEAEIISFSDFKKKVDKTE